MQAQSLGHSIRPQSEVVEWSTASKIAFRFCVTYIGLYVLGTQVLTGLFPLRTIDVPDLASLPPFWQILNWVAATILRLKHPLIYPNSSGSGDRSFNWVFLFCLIVVATLATLLWSVLDRERRDYTRLHAWFHLALRFAVGSQFLQYGMIKIIPLQMPFPAPVTLLQPLGNLTRMGLLWTSIGSSTGYEIFVGSAEALGAVLLFVPRTAMLGTLICLADAIEVFLLNMTYDVSVKQFSFHLLLMCLLLLMPNFSRIASFFLSDSPRAKWSPPALFRDPQKNRLAVRAQVVFGMFLICMNGYGDWLSWFQYGGGAPKSPFSGVWNVEKLTIDGRVRPMLLGDANCWRRVIFGREGIAFQQLDDNFAYFYSTIDSKKGSISITKWDDKSRNGAFQIHRVERDQLILEGQLDRHTVSMELRQFDLKQFPLVQGGFHWVQEYP